MKFLDRIGLGRMSHGEYSANLNGLGIFFGAVLGFVMASTETLGTKDYTVVLVGTASMVITILYVSSSRQRLAYATLAAVGIALFPFAMKVLLTPEAKLPLQLQPTLAVWLAMTVVIEFAPRDREQLDKA
jgi:UDP-N-acetylmuramyl pentapeptide phosphotransferase/UDP-N-acetylglucosamine-1-phosphate transferase